MLSDDEKNSYELNAYAIISYNSCSVQNLAYVINCFFHFIKRKL